MKYSQFNSIIPFHDKYILYNAFNNKSMILEPLLKDIITAAKNEGVKQLSTIHPSFYEALLQNEFIISNTIDEIERVKQLSKNVDLNESMYKLTINPTMNCNFKCWYCYETHIKQSRMDEKIIERTNIFISKIIDNNEQLKYFNLSWFGGEPLLYFYDIVQPIIKHFYSTCKTNNIIFGISFTSNGFLINPKMIEIFKKYEVGHLQITLDGYREQHNEVRYVSATRGSYNEIINNIKLLLRNNITVTMRINYTLKNIDNMHKIADDLVDLEAEYKKNLLVDFHRVWQDKEVDDQEKLTKAVEAFRNMNFTVSSHLSPNNVKDSCYADKKNSAVINYNGDIFKCTARDFTTVKREGYINEQGEIIWENDSLNKRLNAKFNNKPCLSCRIMPLCNGGCSQHALDHLNGEDYCVYSFDETEKDKIILNKFKEAVFAHA